MLALGGFKVTRNRSLAQTAQGVELTRGGQRAQLRLLAVSCVGTDIENEIKFSACYGAVVPRWILALVLYGLNQERGVVFICRDDGNAKHCRGLVTMREFEVHARRTKAPTTFIAGVVQVYANTT